MVCSKYFSKGQLHFQCHRTEAIPVFAFMLCCTASPWALCLKPLSCLIFSAMLHTRESGKGDLSPFQMLPKAGRNQWEAQTHPWGLEAKDTAEVLSLAKGVSFCYLRTRMHFSYWSYGFNYSYYFCFHLFMDHLLGSQGRKLAWKDQLVQYMARLWMTHEPKWWKQEPRRDQETSSWKHPKYPTPFVMLVTEIGKLGSESQKTLQVTKPRALIQQEDPGVTQQSYQALFNLLGRV